MKNRLKTIAVIVAGGSGARMGSKIPKQFLPYKGKTVLRKEYNVNYMKIIPSNCSSVKRNIIIVMAAKHNAKSDILYN